MILACDTSSAVCSVALADGEKVIFKKDAVGAQIHIEKLAPFLKEALVVCKSGNTPVEQLALAIGPGSFNGLRIGLATMKALALTLEVPIIPISSTDALAYGLRNYLEGVCRAVIFSHRNFVHFADYEMNNKEWITSPEFHYTTWDELYSSNIAHYIGTADRGFAEWLSSDQGLSIQRLFSNASADAGHIAQLADLRIDQAVSNLDDLEPFYNARYEAKKWVPPTFSAK